MIVGFMPDELSWSEESFRTLLKQMQADPETELYLLAYKDGLPDYIVAPPKDATKFFTSVAILLEMDLTNNLIIVSDIYDIVDKTKSNNIDIYMSNDKSLNAKIWYQNSLELKSQAVSGCQSIDLNNTQDTYKMQPKYYTFLDFWTQQIKEYRSGKR